MTQEYAYRDPKTLRWTRGKIACLSRDAAVREFNAKHPKYDAGCTAPLLQTDPAVIEPNSMVDWKIVDGKVKHNWRHLDNARIR